MSALTEWNAFAPDRQGSRKSGTPLAYFLVFVSALFIGILIFCYVVTKRAKPVFLDEHGKPTVQNAEQSHH
jgi:hypothetical protein